MIEVVVVPDGDMVVLELLSSTPLVVVLLLPLLPSLTIEVVVTESSGRTVVDDEPSLSESRVVEMISLSVLPLVVVVPLFPFDSSTLPDVVAVGCSTVLESRSSVLDSEMIVLDDLRLIPSVVTDEGLSSSAARVEVVILLDTSDG